MVSVKPLPSTCDKDSLVWGLFSWRIASGGGGADAVLDAIIWHADGTDLDVGGE